MITCKSFFVRKFYGDMAESSLKAFEKLKVFVLSSCPALSDRVRRFGADLPLQVKNVKICENISEENTQELESAEILLCEGDMLVKHYSHVPRLKWAHSTWAGVEKIIAAIPHPPTFTLTKHSGTKFGNLMAEYVVGQILMKERSLDVFRKMQSQKYWASSEMFLDCRLLDEITITILGTGNMGRAIARFLKVRETKILGFATSCRELTEFTLVSDSLSTVLLDCDYIVNTLPSTPRTIGMLNNSVLALCKKNPVFINVGRGDIISEEELIKAISNNWLKGAILDVFPVEPLPKTSQLYNIEQVTITPHIAASSRINDVAQEFLENLRKYAQGEMLHNIVDFKRGY